MDNMQTTESNKIDRNALRSWFSIMNSIPLVARKMGEITAVVKRISVAIFSLSTAIKVSPEATKIANVTNNPRFIRFIIDFIIVGLEELNYMSPCGFHASKRLIQK